MATGARIDNASFTKHVRNGDKLSLAASAFELLNAHIANATPEALEVLKTRGYDEFLSMSESGREILAAGEMVGKIEEAAGIAPSWEELQRKAQAFSESIFENFDLLGSILDRHEATIHRRWLKKSNKLRLAIIHEAWGVTMASSHRPDFEALELESEGRRAFATAYRDHYLLPYINEEDLCKPRSLLLLMSTRGRCHPSEVAIGEHVAHRLGRCAFVFSYLTSSRIFEEHCMDLTSKGRHESYGRLWSIKTQPDRCVNLQNQEYQKPYYGLLVLEAQARVLSFLVRCTKLLLHDIAEDNILRCPVQPFQITPKPDAVHTSLATIAAEAPYQKPDSLDFSRIATLIAAKHDAAADHLWSLREDPGCFEAQMLEYKEHRRELIPDINEKQHPILSPEHEDKFWARVIQHVVVHAYFQVETFAELQSQAEELKDMQNLYANELSTTLKSPELYTVALWTFRQHLDAAARTYSTELGIVLCASPPMRSYHARTPETDPTTPVDGVMRSTGFADDPTRVRFDWLLNVLWDASDMLQAIGLTSIVDELQRLIDTKPAGSLLSSYMTSTVGDLSIVSECLHQLELYQPWAQRHSRPSNEQENDLSQDLVARTKPWVEMLDTISQNSEMGAIGRPINDRFAYPIAKRKTRENVRLMRLAEQNLDSFWHKVDDDIKSKCGNLENSAVHRLLTQDRRLQRTPEWIQPVEESNKPVAEELYIPFPQLFHDEKTCSKQTLLASSAQQPKEKVKTRKSGNLEIPATETKLANAPSQAQTVEIEAHFALNARALKVFKTLFFTPSVTSIPGEVAWADFLHAMISVGFIPRKLYGSVWQFSPDVNKLSAARSIQFHEPHGGNSKIPYRTARRHGRRLIRAYGWDGASFALEEKPKQ